MIRYIARRLAMIPLMLLGVNFLGFAYAHLVRPGQLARNPFLAMAGGTAPLLPAYLEYLAGVVRLDFGAMPPSGAAVGPLVAQAATASLGLLVLTLALSVVLGIGFGVRSVRTPGQRSRQGISEPASIAPWLTVLTTAGLAMPGFYIGSLLILATLWYLIWGPSTFTLPVQGFGWDLHLVLPTLVLAARPTAQVAQLTAAVLAAEMDKMYIVAARSVGQPWQVIRQRQAFRNVIAPVAIAVFGALRLVVGELIIVEWIFSWPGLGRLLAWTLIPPQSTGGGRAVFLHPSTMAAVLTVLAAVFLAGDLVSGLTARVADPRLRTVTQHMQEPAHD
jgi:peptide/nickel transport system permease protein